MLNIKSLIILQFSRFSFIRVLYIFIFSTQISIAQKKDPKKDDNIGTEVVNVIKQYTPTISDASKVGETPQSDELENTKKEIVKYNIFSFPVASTFTPTKGKAEGVEKDKKGKLFNNYATIGGGNYGTLIAELFANQDLKNNNYVGGIFRHLSSQGGIEGVQLKNSFYDTAIDLTYGNRKKDLTWNVDLGYKNQIHNWYGLPTTSTAIGAPVIAGIDPQQSYNNIYLGGEIALNENILKGAQVKINHFSDAFGSSETRFYAKPSFELYISEQLIKTNLVVDYLTGNFDQNYSNTSAIKYGFANFGVTPTYGMTRGNWTMNFGLGLYYSSDLENNKNKFLVYPKINASLKVVGDLMVFYTGADGNLEQNTYADFVNTNPYVSPTLTITPTDRQYDIFAGLKGKLTHTITYNLRTSYINEKNKALFKSNNYSEDATNLSFGFGNSLEVVYDNIKTLSFYSELKADISEGVTAGIDGTLSSYNTSSQLEAWNLPAVRLNANCDFTIARKFQVGTNLFFIGTRKDQKFNTRILSIVAPMPTILNSYVDINAHIRFKYNERLTAFLRANNIANQAYQKWLDYTVQGFQVVLGANYKFDF